MSREGTSRKDGTVRVEEEQTEDVEEVEEEMEEEVEEEIEEQGEEGEEEQGEEGEEEQGEEGEEEEEEDEEVEEEDEVESEVSSASSVPSTIGSLYFGLRELRSHLQNRPIDQLTSTESTPSEEHTVPDTQPKCLERSARMNMPLTRLVPSMVPLSPDVEESPEGTSRSLDSGAGTRVNRSPDNDSSSSFTSVSPLSENESAAASSFPVNTDNTDRLNPDVPDSVERMRLFNNCKNLVQAINSVAKIVLQHYYKVCRKRKAQPICFEEESARLSPPIPSCSSNFELSGSQKSKPQVPLIELSSSSSSEPENPKISAQVKKFFKGYKVSKATPLGDASTEAHEESENIPFQPEDSSQLRSVSETDSETSNSEENMDISHSTVDSDSPKVRRFDQNCQNLFRAMDAFIKSLEQNVLKLPCSSDKKQEAQPINFENKNLSLLPSVPSCSGLKRSGFQKLIPEGLSEPSSCSSSESENPEVLAQIKKFFEGYEVGKTKFDSKTKTRETSETVPFDITESSQLRSLSETAPQAEISSSENVEGLSNMISQSLDPLERRRFVKDCRNLTRAIDAVVEDLLRRDSQSSCSSETRRALQPISFEEESANLSPPIPSCSSNANSQKLKSEAPLLDHSASVSSELESLQNCLAQSKKFFEGYDFDKTRNKASETSETTPCELDSHQLTSPSESSCKSNSPSESSRKLSSPSGSSIGYEADDSSQMSTVGQEHSKTITTPSKVVKMSNKGSQTSLWHQAVRRRAHARKCSQTLNEGEGKEKKGYKTSAAIKSCAISSQSGTSTSVKGLSTEDTTKTPSSEIEQSRNKSRKRKPEPREISSYGKRMLSENNRLSPQVPLSEEKGSSSLTCSKPTDEKTEKSEHSTKRKREQEFSNESLLKSKFQKTDHPETDNFGHSEKKSITEPHKPSVSSSLRSKIDEISSRDESVQVSMADPEIKSLFRGIPIEESQAPSEEIKNSPVDKDSSPECERSSSVTTGEIGISQDSPSPSTFEPEAASEQRISDASE